MTWLRAHGAYPHLLLLLLAAVVAVILLLLSGDTPALPSAVA